MDKILQEINLMRNGRKDYEDLVTQELRKQVNAIKEFITKDNISVH